MSPRRTCSGLGVVRAPHHLVQYLGAEVCVRGELLRRDLMARAREPDVDDLLHAGWWRGQHDDAVPRIDSFVDVVCNEDNG